MQIQILKIPTSFLRVEKFVIRPTDLNYAPICNRTVNRTLIFSSYGSLIDIKF
jgi:hypothetical protein